MAREEIDEYLAALEEPKRSTLTQLRETIMSIVPDAEECISYGMPAFKLRGKTIEPIPIFMLARDNVVIGDDPTKVTFEREGIYTDDTTGKPVARRTSYPYQDGEDRYAVSFTRTRSRMIDSVKGLKQIAARLARFDGAYLRFAGDIEVSHHHGGELVETHADEAIWELMYFGHAARSHTGGRS